MDLGTRRQLEHEQDAVVAELVETVELQTERLTELSREAEALRAERDRVKNELEMARAWVAALAAALETGDRLA
ncbi:MAG: hypothetical protein WBB74_01135 [Gaiellaceae bacterium]